MVQSGSSAFAILPCTTPCRCTGGHGRCRRCRPTSARSCRSALSGAQTANRSAARCNRRVLHAPSAGYLRRQRRTTERLPASAIPADRPARCAIPCRTDAEGHTRPDRANGRAHFPHQAIGVVAPPIALVDEACTMTGIGLCVVQRRLRGFAIEIIVELHTIHVVTDNQFRDHGADPAANGRNTGIKHQPVGGHPTHSGCCTYTLGANRAMQRSTHRAWPG